MILHYFKKKENIDQKIAKDLYKKIIHKSSVLLKENNYFKEKNYSSSFEIVSILLIFYIKLNIQNKIKNYKIINKNLIDIFILDLDELFSLSNLQFNPSAVILKPTVQGGLIECERIQKLIGENGS